MGYFFISGFYKLYPALENVEKIRILVGLQTDRTAYDLQQAKEQGELTLKSHASAKEQVSSVVLSELEEFADSADIETGVHKFVEWIRSGKLEIKAYPSANLHAKVYIMTFAEGDRDKGRVITGSSNLTQAGLQDNLEFNVELKNRADYDFAIAKFNELWAVAVDRFETLRRYRTQQVTLRPIHPLRALSQSSSTSIFANELNRPSELEDIYVPVGFKKLKYQEEAVLNARKVLDEYGGAFLSDVVGLGQDLHVRPVRRSSSTVATWSSPRLTCWIETKEAHGPTSSATFRSGKLTLSQSASLTISWSATFPSTRMSSSTSRIVSARRPRKATKPSLRFAGANA